MSYIPATPEQQRDMLRACGASSINELFADIPSPLTPPKDDFWEADGMSEFEALTKCEKLSSQNNTRLISFLGGGFYDHYIPAAVDAIASRSEFYTAYTPYQPELSQGTLQAIYEYQSQICRLTGMEMSNASLYDGGTAVFEACKMAMAATSRKKIVVDDSVNPIYLKMLRTHIANLGAEVVISADTAIDDTAAAIVMQNPGYLGVIEDHSGIVDKCKQFGVMAIQSVNPIALALIKTPAEQGFDIAVGEGQALGIPLSFGGPYLGFIAVKKELSRRMPGRIVARTVDVSGQQGFVLSLQAREQHIRREKATSNICSNEALCALRAHIYLSLMGTEGLRETASLCHNKAVYMRESLKSIPGVKITDEPVFNEFAIELPINADELIKRMANRGFAAGIPAGANHLLIAVTEKRTKNEIDNYISQLRDALCQ
ncbi:MAG: aminomethyl-transferring glycine dehydrogenase subunit GcvPA [Chitinispirillia bacterium]|nr:aminomethyl-transferring glycine dehydrogenase subunit GcvPA [Chitinispirillia bacterium]